MFIATKPVMAAAINAKAAPKKNAIFFIICGMIIRLAGKVAWISPF